MMQTRPRPRRNHRDDQSAYEKPARRRSTRRRGRRLALLVLILALAAVGAVHGARRLGEAAQHPAGTQSAPLENAQLDELPWYLTLVNASHPIPVDMQVETVETASGERVDERIAQPLEELFAAAREAGYTPYVNSGFRTRDDQEQILESRIEGYEAEGLAPDDAEREARRWVAEPGTSEHELGLAVDINDAYGDEGLYDWLAEHAHEYGFIQRYPSDKADVTGISFEPWHYRYVGVEDATAIWSAGITLEEYLARGYTAASQLESSLPGISAPPPGRAGRRTTARSCGVRWRRDRAARARPPRPHNVARLW